MKKLLIALCITCALAVAATAAEGKGKKKHSQTDEQKAVMKEITAKYDANKDGKLDKTEKARISTEDKDKMKKAGLPVPHKKKDKS